MSIDAELSIRDVRPPAKIAGGRIAALDITKGILIWMVVCFHSNFGNAHAQTVLAEAIQLLLSFMMPAFCFVSGYLSSFKEQTAKSYVRLAVPYVLFEIVYLFALHTASSMGLSTANSVNELSIGTIVHSVLVRPVGAFWYLHALICFLAVSHATAVVSRTSGGIYGAVVFLIGLMLLHLLGVADYAVWSFALGACVNQIFGITRPTKELLLLAIALSSFAFIVFGWDTLKQRGTLPNMLWSTGILAGLYCVSQVLAMSLVRAPLEYLGKSTLVILILHPLAMQLTNRFAIKVDPYLFDWITLPVSVTLNVSICLAIGSILRLHPWTAFLIGEANSRRPPSSQLTPASPA